MLNCFHKNPLSIYNKNLYDYCKKSTNESIKKLTEKYKLERFNSKPLEDEDKDEKTYFNIYGFLTFISITTLTLYFYKRIQ